ncbi:MAG: diguanylate cyclase, partial [Bacillota bacterium]|nr:diguanylate cyclase [Bacillota bacterium]
MRFNEKTRILWQSAVFALLLLILCMIFYTSMQGLWLSKNRQLAKTVALAGSLSVNSEALATIDCSDDEGSATHQSIKHYLQKIRDLHPSIRYVYIVRQTDKEGIVSFWIDAEEDPSLLSPFGEEYDTAQSPLMWESFKGDVQVEPAFTTDKWGTWLSGYAPVRNNQGQVIGVLGVDVDANEIRARNQRTLLYTLFLYVSTCVIGVGLLNVTAFRLNSTITTLTSNLDEKETKLTNLAQLDQLTGLYTHTFLQEHLEKSRGDQEWCLAAIDIQGLAMVNEVYGYDAGDRVLQAVAQSLKVSLAGEGVAARTGGDEFMLLLRFPANQVGPWYDLLRSKLTESITQLGIPFYLSVGVACYPH